MTSLCVKSAVRPPTGAAKLQVRNATGVCTCAARRRRFLAAIEAPLRLPSRA